MLIHIKKRTKRKHRLNKTKKLAIYQNIGRRLKYRTNF